MIAKESPHKTTYGPSGQPATLAPGDTSEISPDREVHFFMSPGGWIKLYRKLQLSPMYRALNSKQRDVMIQCLLLANHSGQEWEWEGVIYRCEPGQFITSLDKLRQYCAKDVSIRNMRTSISKLEMWQFLTNKATKTGRLITIINWASYQSDATYDDKDIDKEVTKSRQSTDKEVTTNKNGKNGKNEKKEDIGSDAQFWTELRSLYTWVDFEKEIAKMKAYQLTPRGKSWQMTKRSVVNWLNKTDKPIGEGLTAIDPIERAKQRMVSDGR